MKHFFLLFVAICICAFSVKADDVRVVPIQGKDFRIDTLRHVKVGPGTMYTALLYRATDGTKKFRGFFLTMDMKGHDNIEYRMELGNDSTLTVECISDVAKRKTKSGNYYIAGVNADFYYTWKPYIGTPNMGCYMDGQIAISTRDESNKSGHFFMDYNKNMWCDWVSQSFSFTRPDNTSVGLTRINYDLFENELVLFNDKCGHYTKTNSSTTEVAIKLVEGQEWSINKPFKVQIVGSATQGGNMKIEPNQAVLSASGTRISDLTSLKDGDVLTMNLNTKLGNYNISPERLKECSGGDVVILNHGEVEYNSSWWINGRDNNNPRTMFGYSKDRSVMVWGLIDGRSSISDGSTYPEGADVMKYAGCYEAVNVDGGGSAGMYVQNLGILNVPADGKERAVSNGFYAVLKAPEDNEIAEIKFVDYAMKFPKHGTYKPQFYGYNKYGMLIDNDVKDVTLSCDAVLGEIKDGKIFIGNGSGTHALTATYKTITSKIPVTIVESDNLSMRLKSVINDTYRKYPVEVEALMNETKMPINPAALSWISDDVSIATIGIDDGILQGSVNGTTTIHGTIGSFAGSMEVIVEKPTAHAMAIDPNLDPATWKITQSGGKHMVATAMENGMKLLYTGASGRGPNIKLTKELKLWSLPDAIRLRINPGDAPIKKITFTTNANSTGVVTIPITTPLVANEINIIDVKTADWCDAKDMKNYPIILKSLYFDMGTSSTGKEYTILMPGIETVYDAVPEGGGVDDVEYANNSISIYPNPVIKGDIVNIVSSSQAINKVSVYNGLGSLIKQLKNNDSANVMLPTNDLETGVYIITISQNGVSQSLRLLVK
ncbi:MAG: phosphodiester glycosidase family protein [Muribaculaceae bacterium]